MEEFTLPLVNFLLFLLFTALLKDVENDSVILQYRQHQLEERKKQYSWMKLDELCLPSAINTSLSLPPDEGFELVKNVNFFSTGAIDLVDTTIPGLGINLRTISGYEVYAKLLGEPEYPMYELSRWTSDVEFGRQILNGVNPVVIQRVDTLPAKFPVTNEMVRSSLNRGLTLQQEIEVSLEIHKLSVHIRREKYVSKLLLKKSAVRNHSMFYKLY